MDVTPASSIASVECTIARNAPGRALDEIVEVSVEITKEEVTATAPGGVESS
ncbi:hypothetical protein LTT66_24885 [Nocardia gipuzkoensis]|uniref:hypothetical protein n=1 Tax=Nocardia gipuzkoensis TaxID=2749991 RepID=UPI001E41A14C|nr:hypothetical protein [Nocardia gipuzkoensis]UGT66498.1 hypothetical protein LTT66_24885 [Nocardia gipuzkoensis]